MARIPAGNMTERVLLKALGYSRNEIGEQVLTYLPVEGFTSAIPAMVKFSKSMRVVEFGQMWEPTTIVVTTRFSQSLLNARRIEWQGKKYDVDGMPNGDRIAGTITYTCTLHDDGTESEEVVPEPEPNEQPESEEPTEP
jgi:SPP1 family predicted phage head-tail adaptor